MKQVCRAVVGLVMASGCASAQPGVPIDPEWATKEFAFADAVALTTRERFAKAGEAYFAPDAARVVFQAVLTPVEGVEADPFYAMFLAPLTLEGTPRLGDHVRVSPEGSANTCGWFHPSRNELLFGSTMTRPRDEEKSGFRVGTRRYVWQFPEEMDIVTLDLSDARATPVRLFEHPRYDAECSYDSTGRFVLFTRVVEAAPGDAGATAERVNGDIYVRDVETGDEHPLVQAPGYDGGPFFSPDGSWICYRSDRKGNDLLQLFVAKLRFEEGVPVGIEREWQVTSNEHVNWAPYWMPEGEGLIYASSEAGHHNYELYCVQVPREELEAGRDPASLPRVRVTHAPGADILPAFSADGQWLMWTSQRAGAVAGEQRPTSQLWIARWRGVSFEQKATPSTGPVRRQTTPVEGE